MRIWHQELIPILCQKHLCAMWREGLGMYKIITENKKGYSTHPATLEFKYHPEKLLYRLQLVRKEMLKRGYHPKKLPVYIYYNSRLADRYYQWQTLEEQINRLKEKKYQCKINNLKIIK